MTQVTQMTQMTEVAEVAEVTEVTQMTQTKPKSHFEFIVEWISTQIQWYNDRLPSKMPSHLTSKQASVLSCKCIVYEFSDIKIHISVSFYWLSRYIQNKRKINRTRQNVLIPSAIHVDWATNRRIFVTAYLFSPYKKNMTRIFWTHHYLDSD